MTTARDAAYSSPPPSGAYFTIPVRSCIVKTAGVSWCGCSPRSSLENRWEPARRTRVKKRNAPQKTKGRPQGKVKKAPRTKTLSLWAVIAIIVAAGMLLSSILIGVDYLTGWRGPGGNSEENWEEYLEQERQRLAEESAALEEKIAADGPTVEDLESLADLYGRIYSYA